MFAVIRENRDRSITRLLTCGSLEAVIVASQLEKNKVSTAGIRRLRCRSESAGSRP